MPSEETGKSRGLRLPAHRGLLGSIPSGGIMCSKKNTECDDQQDNNDDVGDKNSESEQQMTKEELNRKVQEHIEKRRSAYEKMGSVD